jgi:hypothetical protein
MQNQFIIVRRLIRLIPRENGMDRFSELNAFIAVVEAGGFSTSAKASSERVAMPNMSFQNDPTS